jgi:L-ascorbate metabolism protein UlaG (beta-lactamase superfamily)
MEIRFLGHACFELADGDTRVLVDPFLTGNPKAAAQADELEPTHIFLTHGHQDHYGDIVGLARRTGAQVVAITEVAGELSERGLENVADPNIGGTVALQGDPSGDTLRGEVGWVRLTPAWHTSTTPNGQVNTPAGLVINLGGKTVYHVGDTALFSDIRLAGERDRLDAALVCIGGHYTMDRYDAAVACEWIGAPVVIPCHYDTFPPIETDAQAFKSDVEERTGGKTTVEVLEPGETLSL